MIRPKTHADPAELDHHQRVSTSDECDGSLRTCTSCTSCAVRQVRAELIRSRARITTHITTAILLNRALTFRTFLCIGANPIRSLTIILTLLQPLLDQGTNTRLMFRQTATETESMATIALDGWNDRI